jgi:hypothetical protein
VAVAAQLARAKGVKQGVRGVRQSETPAPRLPVKPRAFCTIAKCFFFFLSHIRLDDSGILVIIACNTAVIFPASDVENPKQKQPECQVTRHPC